jgi:hypothetical protein
VIDDMAPEVGLEPTTLRLTASEFPSPSPAIVCCKSLYKSKLENTASTVHCYRYCLIATDFERAWAQKWVQSFQSLLDRFYKSYKSKMRAIFRVTGTKPALKRPASAVRSRHWSPFRINNLAKSTAVILRGHFHSFLVSFENNESTMFPYCSRQH